MNTALRRPTMKTIPRVRAVGFMCCLLFVLAGCENAKKVRLDAVDASLREMATTHDKYVKNDKTLPQVEKDIRLRESQLVIKLLDQASGKKEPETK